MTYVFSRLDSHLMTSSAVSLPLISAKPCSLPSSKSEACPYFMVGYFLMPNLLQIWVCKPAQLINSTVSTSETMAIVKLYSIADIACMHACQKKVKVSAHLLSTVNPGNPYFRLHFWLCMKV